MKTFTRALITATLFGGILLIGGSAFAQVSIGIQIGPPPPPRVVVYSHRPPRPALDFVWVEGYWYPVGRKYVWHGGYWARPPYAGAHWVAPHHDGRMYFAGRWEGPRDRVEHHRELDRDRDRDFRDHDRDHDNGRGHDRH
jgi:WXXGXW repeat (2 copies)